VCVSSWLRASARVDPVHVMSDDFPWRGRCAVGGGVLTGRDDQARFPPPAIYRRARRSLARRGKSKDAVCSSSSSSSQNGMGRRLQCFRTPQSSDLKKAPAPGMFYAPQTSLIICIMLSDADLDTCLPVRSWLWLWPCVVVHGQCRYRLSTYILISSNS